MEPRYRGQRCAHCGRLWLSVGWLSPHSRRCLLCEGDLVPDDSSFRRADLVRGVVLAFNERDVDRMLEFLHPDVAWTPTGVLLGDAARPYNGHRGMRAWAADVAAQWSELRLVERELHLAGEDRVLMLGVLTATSRTTGQGLAEPVALVLEVTDELIRTIEEFVDWERAREAAGLA